MRKTRTGWKKEKVREFLRCMPVAMPRAEDVVERAAKVQSISKSNDAVVGDTIQDTGSRIQVWMSHQHDEHRYEEQRELHDGVYSTPGVGT